MKSVLILSLLFFSNLSHGLYTCKGMDNKHFVVATTVKKGHLVQGIFDCYDGESSLELAIDGTPMELIYTIDGLDYAVIAGDQLLYGYYVSGQLQKGNFDLNYEIMCVEDPASCTIPNGGG